MKDDKGLDVGVEKYGFKHAVEASVRLRVGGVAKAHWHRDQIVRSEVNAQFMELCSGGIQRSYLLTGVLHGGHTLNPSSHPRLFHEHQLEACEPFPCEDDKKPEPVGDTTNQT